MVQKLFKRKYGRAGRVLEPDSNFRKGMRFTDGFLPSQTVKLLVNHRIMDSGAYLTPRPGIRGLDTKIKVIESVATPTSKIPAPHVAYYGAFLDSDGFDKFGNIVISFGSPTSLEYDSYFTDIKTVSADYYTQTLAGESFGTLYCDAGNMILNTEQLLPARVRIVLAEPKPIFTIFNSELYYLGRDEEGQDKLMKVVIAWDDIAGVYAAVSLIIDPKTVPIAEATSIGFNMLDPNPYDFTNTSSLVLTALGILPYSVADAERLMLSANVGEEVQFTCTYDYVTGQTIRAMWEIAVAGATEFVTLHAYEDATYINGAEVSVVTTPPQGRSVIRCTLVPLDGAGEMLSNIAKVAIYPVFETGVSELRDMSTAVYDLHKATGIGVHNDMLALWGVPGVETTLFFSDPLDASFFPFPQNTFTVPDEILTILSYAGSLLIFTERKIYAIEGYDIYSMMYITPIYESIQIYKEDIATIKVVNNNVFFRTNGVYQVLAPNAYTGKVTDLKLYNVSSPVSDLLYDFTSFIKLLSDRLYKFNVSWNEKTIVKQYDFISYIDTGKIKNMHRFVVYEDGEEGRYRYQIDVVMVYDSALSVWYTEVASLPYNGLITQGAALYSTYFRKGGLVSELYLQKLEYKNFFCVDNYTTTFYGDAVNDNPTNAREVALALYPEVGQAIVTRVVDGDTIELEGIGMIRLHYINTPESVGDITEPEPYGVESSTFLKQLLPIGSVVTFEFEGDRADLYNRALCWIFKDGVLVQETMAYNGYVKSIYDFGVTKYLPDIEAALADAIAAGRGLYGYLQKEGPYYVRSKESAELLGNFQILDTGNRDQDPYMEKRYKEIQFMLSNKSMNPIRFYTEFYIDSQRRQTPVSYDIVHDTDPNSEHYGTIYVMETDTPNMVLDNTTHLDYWVLDTSQFPDVEVVKLVFRVSGKGHYPRMLLISKNQDEYKILNYAWVYRVMNAR
jgi:endonuclease YncB( thermonuclease family)